MTWTTTRDLAVYDRAAGTFLRARPTVHTVLLSVTAALRSIGTDAYGGERASRGGGGGRGRLAAAARRPGDRTRRHRLYRPVEDHVAMEFGPQR
ncbi:hypothetical protein [Streptomyces tubercidicus]